MIVRLRKIETTGDGSPASSAPSTESAMIADQMNAASLTPRVKTNRRLRNWIILANIATWVLIILAVRLIFF